MNFFSKSAQTSCCYWWQKAKWHCENVSSVWPMFQYLRWSQKIHNKCKLFHPVPISILAWFFSQFQQNTSRNTCDLNKTINLTSPYPHTTTCLPPNITSVVLFKLETQMHVSVLLLLYHWKQFVRKENMFYTRLRWILCSSKGCRTFAW